MVLLAYVFQIPSAYLLCVMRRSDGPKPAVHIHRNEIPITGAIRVKGLGRSPYTDTNLISHTPRYRDTVTR